MAYREYIGSRYVPIFGRKDEASIEWDNTKPYEPLTIVTHQGNSYTSRQNVPAGIDITNDAYWALTGNYNSQVEQYRQEVTYYNNRITDLENKFPVNSTDIANSAITENKIASGAVTQDKIANGAVTQDKIANGAVTQDKIANGAITANKIASGNVAGMPDYANAGNVTTTGTNFYMAVANDGVVHPFASSNSNIIDSSGVMLQNGYIEFQWNVIASGTSTYKSVIFGYINNKKLWLAEEYIGGTGGSQFYCDITSGMYPVKAGDVIAFRSETYEAGRENTDGDRTGYAMVKFIPLTV